MLTVPPEELLIPNARRTTLNLVGFALFAPLLLLYRLDWSRTTYGGEWVVQWHQKQEEAGCGRV